MPNQGIVHHRVFHSMGIPVHCTLVGCSESEADHYIREAEKIFNDYDTRFSRFKETSELHRLNMSAGTPTRVSVEMFQVLKKCVALAEETSGAFDPSVGGVLASYGYGLPENFTPPTPLPAYRDIIFDNRELTITLAVGQVLEPANIVKGIAIDATGEAFRSVLAFMINAGGDILTRGAFKKGGPWNIAIQDPRDPRAVIAAVAVQNVGIATSGTYQARGETSAGTPWHHIIDMRTGKSTEGIMSATVVAPTCEQADTEASLAILLGSEEGIARLEKTGLPYCIILENGAIRKNVAFAALEIPLEALVKN